MKTLQSNIPRLFVIVGIFAVAMGFMESAVVIYLRKIYYPEGFSFPMKFIDNDIAIVEIIREFSTIVMLIITGVIAGKTKAERFAWFLYSFAVWDIFYYVFLKLFIGWPATIIEWDILFLIPTVWSGPVVAPIICSLLMIILASIIVSHARKFPLLKIGNKVIVLLTGGSFIVIVSFLWDYVKFSIKETGINSLFSTEEIKALNLNYIPESFPWWMFFIGIAVIVLGIGLYIQRANRFRN